MRRIMLAMGLVALLAPTAGAAENAKAASDGYRALGELAVMDQGRIKPLQTLAIARVKSIYSRQTIKLLDEDGEVRERWEPVAAVLDWMARPEYWNDQEFILVDSAELMRKLVAGEARALLNAIAARPATSAADRAALEKLATADEPAADDLRSAAALGTVAKADRAALARLESKLTGGNKWVSPNLLESAEVLVAGKRIGFQDWFRDAASKQGGPMGGGAKLTKLEEKAVEVGMRFFSYRSFREIETAPRAGGLVRVVPRPGNDAYLEFSAEAYRKDVKSRGADVTPLEADAVRILDEFLDKLPREEKALPKQEGRADFDAKFVKWLKEGADWVPMSLLLTAEDDEIAKAGFPRDKVQAFRDTFHAAVAAEKASPRALPASAATPLVAAARELGAATGSYPPVAELARESHYNRFAPFYRAPLAYGTAFFLLLLVLGLPAANEGTATTRRIGSFLYGFAMAAYLAGVALSAYGFYLRVLITGWAPVTGMAETVIWVAMITGVIGLVLELISRRSYAALAGSGMALLTSILAVNVPLLDPEIKALQPVLRSNYWLTIHVLTIVSSYAAFALALGLGLLAVGYYLTTNYRRRPGPAELAAPLVLGLPLAIVGAWGVHNSYNGATGSWWTSDTAFYVLSIVLAIGGMTSITALYGLIGELASRRPAVVALLGLLLLAAGSPVAAAGWIHAGPHWMWVMTTQYAAWGVGLAGLSWMFLALFGTQARATLRAAARQAEALDEAAVEGDSYADAPAATARAAAAGGTATLARPSIAEIKARVAGSRPKLDAVGLAMQETAGRLKPLTNFIYRAMQVGVLLCAAGTILGGVWADYSWGRFWGWDPKEVWALITLLVYLVPLHGRFAGWVNPFGLVIASVACFASVLMAWYGVNFVLGVGLHSYGFMEGGGQGIVITCALAVLSVALGAAWRRRLSSRGIMAA